MVGRSDEDNLSYEGWRVAGAASVGVFVSFASLLVYTFGTFLKPLAEEFSWSREAVSAAFGIAAMSVAVCSPPLGLLLDRYGARRIIVPALAIFGGALASLALLTPPLWHFYALFVVLGIVGNGTAQMDVHPRRLELVREAPRGRPGSDALGERRRRGGAPADRPGVDRRRRLADRVCAARRDGPLRGPAWRARVCPRASVDGSGAGNDQRRRHRTRGRRQPRVLDSDRGPLLQFDCAERSDHAPVAAAHGSGCQRGGRGRGGFGDGRCRARRPILTGWLLDRFFAARVSFALLSAAALGTWLLSWAHTLPLGVASAALIGFGMGGEGDVTPYLLSRYFGLRSFSTLYGLTWTAYAIAGAIGPVLMGQAFDVWDRTRPCCSGSPSRRWWWLG